MSSYQQGAAVFKSPSWGYEKTSASSEWTQIYGNVFTSTDILFALPRIYMVSASWNLCHLFFLTIDEAWIFKSIEEIVTNNDDLKVNCYF